MSANTKEEIQTYDIGLGNSNVGNPTGRHKSIKAANYSQISSSSCKYPRQRKIPIQTWNQILKHTIEEKISKGVKILWPMSLWTVNATWTDKYPILSQMKSFSSGKYTYFETLPRQLSFPIVGFSKRHVGDRCKVMSIYHKFHGELVPISPAHYHCCLRFHVTLVRCKCLKRNVILIMKMVYD